MPENVTEFRGQFNDVLVISELRGSYPNVPISSDVDYENLIAGDSEPVFLTLPIAKVNAKSGNNRYYDEAFVTELMRQTLTNKPVGLFGHMSESERATAFKPEAVHWVGAVRDGDLVWGKAYLVGDEARARIRRYKASGKTIATSIDAMAEGAWDESLKAYRMKAESLKLGQIDLAPADRAGIPDLAAVPILTTEMDAPATEVEQEIHMPDKLEIIQELKREDARLLPDEVRSAILETVQTPPEVALVQEVRAALGVDEKADLKQVVTELRQAQETARKDAIKARITELVNTNINLESARGIVTELVQARNPQTVDEVGTIFEQVKTGQAVAELLQAQVQRTMGPRQTTPLQGQNGTPKYVIYPQEA